MPRTRFSTAAYLILVFSSGILVGAVSHRLYTTATVNADTTPPRTMAQYRKQFFSEMRRKVGASEAQLSQINTILDDAKSKLDDLHTREKPLRERIDQDRVDGIRAVFDDKQRIAYDNWRAERARLQAEKQKKEQAQQK